jgi:large subunit ribosomal protein L9
MKVIFMQDVPNIGKAGQVKEVSDGYARNYLILRKLAMPARPQDIKDVEAQIKARARQDAKTEAEMKALAQVLEGKGITIKARAGQQDRLYGSITGADIAAALESQHATVVDKRKIEISEPIHKIGVYDVPIKLAKDIAANIKVTVIASEEK